jgi:hypothetical protein
MKKWHRCAVEAVTNLGKKLGYLEVMSPGSFHLWHAGRYIFEYKPDVVWLHPKKGVLRAYVWEIESKWPDTKRVCGDAVLASLIKPGHAFCFLPKESPCEKYGVTLRSTETSDWTGRIIGEAGEDCRLSPELRAFFLLVEEYETKRNARPYLEAIKDKTKLFSEKTAKIMHLPALPLNVSSMMNRLRSDDRSQKVN